MSVRESVVLIEFERELSVKSLIRLYACIGFFLWEDRLPADFDFDLYLNGLTSSYYCQFKFVSLFTLRDHPAEIFVSRDLCSVDFGYYIIGLKTGIICRASFFYAIDIGSFYPALLVITRQSIDGYAYVRLLDIALLDNGCDRITNAVYRDCKADIVDCCRRRITAVFRIGYSDNFAVRIKERSARVA